MNLSSVLKNVVSRETDVREVLAKVALDEADAGFVYSTDARTVPKKVKVLKIPAWAQPKVQYGICVVSASHNKAGRERVHQARPEPGRPEDPAALRLPAARQAMKRRRALLGALTLAAAVVALAFLVLPVAAIFLRVPPGKLLHQLTSPVVTDALIVSVKTSAIAQALILLFGTPLAYLVASRRFRGRALVVTLVELPLVLPPAVAGIGLLGALRPRGAARDEHPVHADGRRARGRLRLEPALHPAGDRGVRGGRPGRGRRLAHARRRPGADVLPGRAAARARRARGRRGARVRARPGRVRRDDHVRRQPAGPDPDAAARDLPGVRARLRHGARDGRAARGRQRRAAGHPQAGAHVATLSADFRASSSLVRAEARARGRAHGRARRALGGGQELGAARDRRARAADRPDRARRARSGSTRTSAAGRRSAASGSSSRSTRSSRT